MAAGVMRSIGEISCPECGQAILVPWRERLTGERVPSSEQPNAEGGTEDVVGEMDLDTDWIDDHLRDAHAR